MATVLSWPCNGEKSWHANRDCQIEWSREFAIRGKSYLVTLPECEVSRAAICSYQCRKMYMKMAAELIAERLKVNLVRDIQMPHRGYGLREVSMYDAMGVVGPACSGPMSTYYDLDAVVAAMGEQRRCRQCGAGLWSIGDLGRVHGWHLAGRNTEYVTLDCCCHGDCSEKATAEAHRRAKAIFKEKEQWRKARKKFDEVRASLRQRNAPPRAAKKSASAAS